MKADKGPSASEEALVVDTEGGQTAGGSALCRLPKLCRQCAVATSPLHSRSSFFLFFLRLSWLSWPSIGSCRLTALSRDSELSAWYSYDDLRCKTIPNHRSLLPRLQNRILLYHILYSRTQFQVHLNIL